MEAVAVEDVDEEEDGRVAVRVLTMRCGAFHGRVEAIPIILEKRWFFVLQRYGVIVLRLMGWGALLAFSVQHDTKRTVWELVNRILLINHDINVQCSVTQPVINIVYPKRNPYYIHHPLSKLYPF